MQTEKQQVPKIDLGQQEYFEGDIILPETKLIADVIIKPSAVYENKIWPTKKIPYYISPFFSMIVDLYSLVNYTFIITTDFVHFFQPKMKSI